MKKSSSNIIIIVVVALVAAGIGFGAGFLVRRREKFDASKVSDPKVRAEMEYIKKMYFS